MASISTSHPLGTKWHPLPIMSGIGLMCGYVVMKLTHTINMPWWSVILTPLVVDAIINIAIVAVAGISYRISNLRDNDKSKARSSKTKRRNNEL